MLSRIIVSSYRALLEACLWLILIGSFGAGWAMKNLLTGVLACGVAFVCCVVFFGAFLVLVDIQHAVRLIEARRGACAPER